MNILVSAMSLYTHPEEKEYLLQKEGREIRVSACQTNEPVPKALSLYLSKKGEALDQIVLLCTPAALSFDANGKSAVDYFKNAMRSSGIDAEIHTLLLNEKADSESIYFTGLELTTLCRTFSDPKLYIDSTGGFRDAMMFLISMMQLLKEEKIQIADVFYTVLDRKVASPHPIVSRMDAYRVYDLISGYEDLKTYGDPTKLKEYFSAKDLSAEAAKILDALQSVYHEMKLCRVAQTNSALLRLSRLLEEYTPAENAFDRVVELAETKYGGIRDGFTYPDYIKWYYAHGYVPQTLAFFYETLPEILVSGKILYYGNHLKEVLQKDFVSNVPHRKEPYSFFNSYFKKTFGSYQGKVRKAKKEVLSLANADSIPIEQLSLSESGKKLYEGLRYCLLGKHHLQLLKKPEASFLLEVLQNGKMKGFERAEDLWNFDNTKKILERIAGNEKMLCALYGIAREEKELTDREHARLILASIDGKNTFLKEGVSEEVLGNLLEKYFYLKHQRDSVLHVGQDSASPKTLRKQIAEAISLMEEILK